MHDNLLNSKIVNIIQSYLINDLKSIDAISGGMNSSVYKITCSDKNEYIVKFYFSHPSDNRNRLETEFSALQFLHLNNIVNVPKPLFKNKEYRFAIFEFFRGYKIKSESATHSDVDQLIDFLYKLNRLKYNKKSLKLDNASESCFSIQEYIRIIQERLDRLDQLDRKKSTVYEMFYSYMNEKFIPAFFYIKRCYLSKFNCDHEIERHQKTISPSDYGFHNALRISNNQIKFLDFEYFGWDDPAKMICDFLLHPAMDLSFDLKQYYFSHIIDLFEDSLLLKERIIIVYPLVALKWCMILLNEFVPEHLMRRHFSGYCKKNIEKKQKNQLKKSELMLKKAVEAYERFPFR